MTKNDRLFDVVFVLASVVGSLAPLPQAVPELAKVVSGGWLVLALFCLGAEINRETLLRLRGRVLAAGLLLWAIVLPTTLMAVLALT